MATSLCKDIRKRNKIPLLVGGTMMYFNALQQGLSTLPTANEDIRHKLIAKAEQYGWPTLHVELSTIDPPSAQRIHPNDIQRIQRALEVYYVTGKPLSQLLLKQEQDVSFSFINLFLLPDDRAWLHDRIAQRFHSMLAQGFLDEVNMLIKKWAILPSMPAMRCVGYRQALAYLNGESNYQDFVEKGIAATRQLAKRQLTWLRNWPQGQGIHLTSNKPDYCSKNVAIISEILDNNAIEKT